MYTTQQVDNETLRILMSAAPGKDPNGRPKGLCAYQICDLFDDAMANHFIAVGGVGGGGGGSPGPAFTIIVRDALRRLQNRGLVRVSYMDTYGLVFTIKGWTGIHPSYAVMAVYQYAGPRAVVPPPQRPVVQVFTRTPIPNIDSSQAAIDAANARKRAAAENANGPKR